MKADKVQAGRRNHCHHVAFRPYRGASTIGHWTLSQLAMVGFWPLGLSRTERDNRDELRVCLVRGQGSRLAVAWWCPALPYLSSLR